MSTPPGVIPLTQPISEPPLARFDKYVLVRKLAEGGMAEIYLAKQVGAEGFERDVVLKLMLGHLTSSREFVEMFLDEARLAAKLHHPNIVQISDLGQHQGRYFICMEYLPGEDLQSVLVAAGRKGEPVPLDVASRIILSACEGLEFAHSYQEHGVPLGVVHRDVSPSNIIVTYQGQVKVVDFGIAKAGSKLTQTQPGLLKGKLGYMSPEQARGEPLDARSDVFSLGITFHELLTGQRVFQKEHEIGVLLAVMQQDIPPPSQVRPDIPPELDRIVLKALEKDLPHRYPDAGALRIDLERYLSAAGSPGMSHLGQYMAALFGRERARERTDVPSLRELGVAADQAGAEDPARSRPLDRAGVEPTYVRLTTPMGVAMEPAREDLATARLAPRTPAADLSAEDRAAVRRGGGARALAWALAAVLLVGAGAGGYYLLAVLRPRQLAEIQRPPEPPAPPREPIAVVTPPPVEPPPVVAPETPPPPPVEPPPPAVVVPRKPIALTTRLVKGTLSRVRPQVKSCFDRHRPQLPSGAGRLEVELGIANSGAVSSARVVTAGFEDGPLAGCLSRTLRALRFPRNNNDPPLKIIVPYSYSAAGP